MYINISQNVTLIFPMIYEKYMNNVKILKIADWNFPVFLLFFIIIFY